MAYQGGPNLGVDFKGGRAYVVDFNKTMVASDCGRQAAPRLRRVPALK